MCMLYCGFLILSINLFITGALAERGLLRHMAKLDMSVTDPGLPGGRVATLDAPTFRKFCGSK